MPKIDLLNCPFCGGKAEIISMSEKFTVSCGTGGCMANISYCSDKQSAVKSWNKRASDWIPCSERMPEKNGDYLVYRRTYGFDIVPYDKDVVKDGCFPFGYWDNYRDEIGYTESDWYEIDDVTHWMTLPEPPGGDNNA